MMEIGGIETTQNRRTVSGSTSDIISNLPWEVMVKILACLKIQDAARTSILSRKWRYTWTTLPQLVFDGTFCEGSMMNTTTDKLMLTIYKVLLLHHGPILKFTLSSAKLNNCPEIDPLVFFVSKNAIREFTLHISNGEPYRLPSMLFSCQQLEDLNLRNCMFKPPPGFKGFTMLLSLELCQVVIADALLSSLISSCPLLERLTLRSSTSFDYLEIVAPNLMYLHCEGLFRSICFKNTSQLISVSVYLNEWRNQSEHNEGEISVSVMLLGSLPVVEFLELDYYYVKCMAAGGIPDIFLATFNHLKSIRLYDVCFGKPDEISVLLCLIRSSPNLEEISVLAFHSASADVDPDLKLFDVQVWLDVSLNKLWKVEMRIVSGTKPEMEFVKLMLAKSPILKIIKIKLNSKEVAEHLRIVKELAGFRRASPHAVITF